MEKTTIVVTARDRFSTLGRCLRNILKQTPEPFDLWAVIGGLPSHIEKSLRAEFGSKIRFVLQPEFLNTAQARNLALKEIQTRLAIFLDSDVFVRPGWYAPLVQCQVESGADLVGPLVLDRQNLIHTAGGDFFMTEEKGEKFVSMEVRYSGQRVAQGTNLKRCDSDFIEVHCQLVVCDTMRQLGVYEEKIREFHELDSGFMMAKHKRKVVFEPASVVYLHYTDRLDDVDDIEIFRWKWNMRVIRENFEFFKQKWNYNVNHHSHAERFFGSIINQRLSFFARHWPSKLALVLDQWRFQLYLRSH